MNTNIFLQSHTKSLQCQNLNTGMQICVKKTPQTKQTKTQPNEKNPKQTNKTKQNKSNKTNPPKPTSQSKNHEIHLTPFTIVQGRVISC